MAFLQDYVYYSSGNECPEEYLHWCGLSVLGHVLGNKVWVKHGGYFHFHPNLYICLVGDAGAGKNTGLGVNMDIMLKEFPELLLSASVQSREDIALQMADDERCMQTWKDKETGMVYSYRPFYILNNELASFLSLDKVKMVEFLTEVYDGKRFATGFKKDRIENPQRKQWFDNPHLSLIAGAVPDWFMGSLKMDLFSGGLGRRLIIVNAERKKIIPDPQKPPGADEAMKRVIEHLRLARQFQGEVLRTPDAMKWWNEWYTAHKKRYVPDPILSQFEQTMHMQVLKVALILRMTELPLGLDLHTEHLQAALALIQRLQPGIVRLTSGIGRNELAGVGVQMMDYIDRRGGMVSEIELKKRFHAAAKSPEFTEIENHYQVTGELVVALAHDGIVNRKFYFTYAGYQTYETARKEKAERIAKLNGVAKSESHTAPPSVSPPAPSPTLPDLQKPYSP